MQDVTNVTFAFKGMQRHCPNRSVLGILKHDGTFAEYLSLPEKNLHSIPDSITDQQAVFVEPLAAAFEIKEQLTLNPEPGTLLWWEMENLLNL